MVAVAVGIQSKGSRRVSPSVLGECEPLPSSLALRSSTSSIPGHPNFQAEMKASPGAGRCFVPIQQDSAQSDGPYIHSQRLLGVTVELWGLHKIYP